MKNKKTTGKKKKKKIINEYLVAINNGSQLHHRGEFLRNYYTFESDHDGVVRIFVGLFLRAVASFPGPRRFWLHEEQSYVGSGSASPPHGS